MSYPGQVFEDPEYYEDDNSFDDEDYNEGCEDFATYDPFDTVNS